jgi:GTP-binding protein
LEDASGDEDPMPGDGDVLEDEALGEETLVTRPCRVALVGRPNVGKSSFLNLLAGEMLSLVDDKPGTTRDVVDTEIERDGKKYVLLDTAGMRRPSRVEEGVERISVRRSLEAIDRADVVVVIVEPEEGVTDQDARIARRAWEEGRALVLLINKIDLAKEAQLARVESNLRDVYPTLSPVPAARISVKRGYGIDEAFALIDRAYAAHNRRLTTSEVNRVLAEAARRREPPIISRGRAKLFYGTQTAVRPPTFGIFTNRIELPEEYIRFLERCFREVIDFTGTPVRLRFVRRDSHGARDPGDAPPKEKQGRDRRGMKSRRQGK